MSGTSSHNNPLEDQLRDWGRATPSESRPVPLAFRDLASRQAIQRKRSRRLIAAGISANVVLLIACIAIVQLQKPPVVDHQYEAIAEVTPVPRDELLEPSVFLDETQDATIEPSVTQNTSLTSLSSETRRRRWIEAKRTTAQDHVLQQWLAENL